MFSFGVKVMRALALSAIMTCCVSVASAESLRIGDQGSEIAEVQEQLSSMGYDVVADGDFGPATAEAVKVGFECELLCTYNVYYRIKE